MHHEGMHHEGTANRSGEPGLGQTLDPQATGDEQCESRRRFADGEVLVHEDPASRELRVDRDDGRRQ